jgi:anti-sigma B factor antagonist
MTSAPSPQASPTGFFLISQHAIGKDARVVCVEGELDLSTAPQLKRALAETLRARCREIVGDLAKVPFMDSTALGVLIGVNKSLDVGARMAIVCTNENVLRIFEFSGLDGTFAIFPTFDEALAHARGTAGPAG